MTADIFKNDGYESNKYSITVQLTSKPYIKSKK